MLQATRLHPDAAAVPSTGKCTVTVLLPVGFVNSMVSFYKFFTLKHKKGCSGPYYQRWNGGRCGRPDPNPKEKCTPARGRRKTGLLGYGE